MHLPHYKKGWMQRMFNNKGYKRLEEELKKEREKNKELKVAIEDRNSILEYWKEDCLRHRRLLEEEKIVREEMKAELNSTIAKLKDEIFFLKRDEDEVIRKWFEVEKEMEKMDKEVLGC